MPISLEQVLSNIIEGFVEVDGNLHVIEMNENAETLLRRSRADTLGKHLEEVIPDATKSQHWPAFRHLATSGRTETISVFFPAQYRWFDIRVIPRPSGGAGLLMRDVTDRQWLIRREAERVYLTNVFEDAPVAITMMRGKNLIIEYLNALARQLVGGRRMIGLPLRDALADLEQRDLFEVIERVQATGVAFQARDVYARFDRNADGQLDEGYFDVSYQAVRDFDGAISGVLSLSIEVTDRHGQRAAAGDRGGADVTRSN